MSDHGPRHWWTDLRNRIGSYIHVGNLPVYNEEAAANLPIKIDEDFAKAKRNLFWGCSIAILLSISTRIGLESACVELSLLGGFKIVPTQLAVVLLGYLFYLYYLHRYNRMRVLTLNSSVALRDSSKSVQENINLLGQRLESISNDLNNVKSDHPFYGVARRLGTVEDSRSIIDGKSDIFREVKTTFGNLDSFVSLEMENYRNDQNTRDELVQIFDQNLEDQMHRLRKPLENLFDVIDRLDKFHTTLEENPTFSQEFEKLSRLVQDSGDDLSNIERQISSLSGSILEMDRKKFTIADVWIPRIFFGLSAALLATIVVMNTIENPAALLGQCPPDVAANSAHSVPPLPKSTET